MDPFMPGLCCDYEPGEIFLPEARRRIRKYRRRIAIKKADLNDFRWSGGRIKILLVDAMKTKELASAITSAFMPHLVQKGVVIHQDYKHYYTPWIHILQFRLRDYFKLRHNVIRGGTVSFELVRSIEPGRIAHASNFERVPDEEVDDAVAYSAGLVDEKGKKSVAAAHIMFFVHERRPEKARELMERYSRRSLIEKKHLDKITLAAEKIPSS